MATRDELTRAVAGRYIGGSKQDQGRILDEFVSVTGYHRKHAMWVLRSGLGRGQGGSCPDRCVYDDAVCEALIILWKAI